MERLRRETFFVSDWKVEPLLHRVSRGGDTIQVEPKLIDVLIYLAGHAGQVVTREQILQDVWSDTIVTDHALTRSISELRRILDDDSKEPSIIETIPKSGYRLVAPISLAESSSDGVSVVASDVSFRIPQHDQRQNGSPFRMRIAAVLAGIVALVILVVASNVIMGDPPRTPSYSTRPLTSLPGREVTPVFSPDGERVAFAWLQELREDSRDIYVRQVNSENSIALTSGVGQNFYPAWSPDGDRLAFIRYREDACGIFTVSALGTSERKIDDCRYRIKDLTWSPDGRHLAYSGREVPTNPYRIYLLDLETLERSRLTDPPSHVHGDDIPVFSPEGKMVAFRRSRAPGINDIYTIGVGETRAEAERRTFDQRTVSGYDWTADGKELVYTSNRTGLFRIWRLSLANNESRAESGISAWDPSRPVISRRGDRLAFVEWFYEINLWEIPLNPNTGDSQPVIESSRGDYLPSYSPDGARIAFNSDRSGSSEIWVADSDGTDPLRLTDLGHAATKSAGWSPDGRHIVFESVVDGYSRIYVVDAEGGTPNAIFADTADAVNPSWSRDGQWIYFGSNRSGEWQIWRIRRDGSRLQKVTQSSGYAASESPDGSTLYFTRYDADGIWSIDLRSGEERRVVEKFPASTWTAWTVRDDGLYFLRRGSSNSLLYRVDGEGGESEVTAFDCAYLEHSSGLSISPDGSRLLTACIDRAESDIMLVENYR